MSSSMRVPTQYSEKKPNNGSIMPLKFPLAETFVDLFNITDGIGSLHEDDFAADGDWKRDMEAVSDDLRPLTNSNSSYNAVARAILVIHQSLSLTSAVHGTDGSRSSLILDSQYYSTVSFILSGLSYCSMQHTDRRCRLLSLRTLPVVTWTALTHLYGYSMLPPTPFNHDHTHVGDAGDMYLALHSSNQTISICRRLEDDICHLLVADTLLPLILHDDDELICTGALQILGIILYAGIYSIQEHMYCYSLNRHVLAMGNPCSLSLSRLLRSTSNSSSSFLNLFNPLQLLATRIMDSTLLPRMRQVLDRITLLKLTNHQTLDPPIAHMGSSLSNLSTISYFVLTPVLTYLSRTEYFRKCQLQHKKSTIAKRASEFNSQAWIREYIQSILEPLLDRPSFSSSSHVKNWQTISCSTVPSVGLSIPVMPMSSQGSKTRVEPPNLEDESATTTSSNNSTTASQVTSPSSSLIHPMVKLISTALVSGIDFAAVSSAIELCVAFSASYKQPWVDSLIRKVVAHLLSSPLTSLVSHSIFPYGPEYQMNSEWMKDVRNSSLIDNGGETLKQWMALLLFSIRGLPTLEEKLFSLSLVSKLLLLESLPSLENTPNPHGKESIDLVLLHGAWVRPVRLGYWIEIAMVLILPDRNYPRDTVFEAFQNKDDKSDLITKYFSSLEECITTKRNRTAQSETDDVINVLMEMTLVFCSCFCIYGEWLCESDGSVKATLGPSKEQNRQLHDWLTCSLIILTKLSFCLHGDGIDEERPAMVVISVEAGAQFMFVRLLRMVLQSTGYLTSSSVYLSHVTYMDDSPHVAPSFTSKTLSTTTNINETISSLIDLVLLALVSENTKISRLSLIAIITDAWTSRLKTMDFNHVSIVKMESQAMIILRQLTDEMFTLRQKVSNDLILAGKCVEKLAVCISEWSEKTITAQVHTDTMETVQNILIVCLQTIAVDDLFSHSIRKIRSLLDDQGDAAIPANLKPPDHHHDRADTAESLITSSLSDFSLGLILTRYYCTLTLANTKFDRNENRKQEILTGNSAFDYDSIIDMEKTPYDEGYIYQIYKQVILDRCDYFLKVAPTDPPCAEGLSRPFDPFQVFYPVASSQISEHELSLWPGSAVTVSGSSDPIHVICAYAPERSIKNDCSTCWALKVIVQVLNITPVSIPRGIQMEVNVSPTHPAFIDDHLNRCSVAVRNYRQEIKSGDSLTFSVIFDSLPFGKYVISPCITFLGMRAENSNDVEVIKQRGKDSEGNFDEEDDAYLDESLYCLPITTSIFTTLRPNPLVFFRNSSGDEVAFNFLWSSCTNATKLEITSYSMNHCFDEEENFSGFSRNAPTILVKSAKLRWPGDKAGDSIHAWAFRAWCGSHLLVKNEGSCIVLRSDNPLIIQILESDEEAQSETMHVFSSYIV